MRARRAACRTCGLVETQITRGRCRACYQYRRRTGRERPAYLRDPRLPFVCGVGTALELAARWLGCEVDAFYPAPKARRRRPA
jgi:hypothetical protein